LKKTRTLAIGAFTAVAALSLAACSSGGSGDDDTKSPDAVAQKTVGTVDGAGKTLTVWLMNGDISDENMKVINDKFEAATGAKVKVEVQQWDGIGTKLTTALSTDTPPDVIDIGNTQVAGYAATGGLMDISAYKDDLSQGQTWLPGLVDPATVDGNLYAVPSFAAARAVVYNKTMWADAGITALPTTYDELTADLDKIKAKNTGADFSAFYLPGQYWYAGLQWVWDNGGDVAKQDGDTWSGTLSSAESQKGLEAFKTFQNTYSSKASQTLNTDDPNQDNIMADGKTSAVIANAWEVGVIQAANKKIELGTFAVPGINGKPQPTITSGSAWGIAAKSKNQDLALAWTKIAADPEFQYNNLFEKQGWVPNSKEGLAKAQASDLTELQKGFFDAATDGRVAPVAANWATIEGDKTMENLFSSIASGSKTPADAAKSTDSHIAEVLNG
jgi:N,N'-diacetylchitobiose transport system substrate-binding protein